MVICIQELTDEPANERIRESKHITPTHAWMTLEQTIVQWSRGVKGTKEKIKMISRRYLNPVLPRPTGVFVLHQALYMCCNSATKMR